MMPFQVFAQNIVSQPSAVRAISETYIDFKPGFRAQKGLFLTAKIENVTSSDCELYNNGMVSNSDIESDLINDTANDHGSSKTKHSNLSVYPNPFLDNIEIAIVTEGDNPLRIDIFNVQGQLVKAVVNRQEGIGGYQVFNVDVEDLKPGMYFINVKSINYSSSQKIVK